MPAGLTVAAFRRALTARLAAAGNDSAELDARLLVGFELGLDLTGLVMAQGRIVSEDEAIRLEQYADRRIAGEPLARIIGAKEFWGLPLRLSPATLVPRADTETLVEAALKLVRSESVAARPLRIADLGTGSGAILLALLSELPGAFGIGTDLSEEALRTARDNAGELGLLPRTAFAVCDYAAALTGPFDLIVSNPPYIRSGDMPMLDPEVRDHDPHAALDGGDDGLDAYRRLAPCAAGLLAPGGRLLVEVGHDQAEEVQRLFAAAGLTPAGVSRDLAGICRVVMATWFPR